MKLKLGLAGVLLLFATCCWFALIQKPVYRATLELPREKLITGQAVRQTVYRLGLCAPVEPSPSPCRILADSQRGYELAKNLHFMVKGDSLLFAGKIHTQGQWIHTPYGRLKFEYTAIQLHTGVYNFSLISIAEASAKISAKLRQNTYGDSLKLSLDAELPGRAAAILTTLMICQHELLAKHERTRNARQLADITKQIARTENELLSLEHIGSRYMLAQKEAAYNGLLARREQLNLAMIVQARPNLVIYAPREQIMLPDSRPWVTAALLLAMMAAGLFIKLLSPFLLLQASRVRKSSGYVTRLLKNILSFSVKHLENVKDGIAVLVPEQKKLIARLDGRLTFVNNLIAVIRQLNTRNQSTTSTIAEQIGSLKYAMGIATPSSGKRILLVTGESRKNGRHFTAAYLSLNLALDGTKVLMVDFDPVHNLLTHATGLAGSPGLSDYFYKGASLQEIVQPTVQHAQLYLIAPGSLPEFPFKFADKARLGRLLVDLQVEFDALVLCSPSQGLLAELAVLAAHCEAAVYVTADPAEAVLSGLTRWVILKIASS